MLARRSADGSACPACGGTGFVVVRGETADRVSTCECRHRHRAATVLSSAGIPRRYEHCRLNDFATLNGSLENALAFARRFVEEFPAGDSYGLVFVGPCGVGKTHLAVAALREIVEQWGRERDRVGLVTEFNDLLRRLQDTYDSSSRVPSHQVLGPILSADVLVLDDVGATRMTAWMQDTLGLIINERYNAMARTIVTANASADAADVESGLQERIGARVYSRLAEMCHVVRMTGQDFRQQVVTSRHRSR